MGSELPEARLGLIRSAQKTPQSEQTRPEQTLSPDLATARAAPRPRAAPAPLHLRGRTGKGFDKGSRDEQKKKRAGKFLPAEAPGCSSRSCRRPNGVGEQSRHRLHAEIFQLLLLHENEVAASSQSTSLSRGTCCHSVLRMLKEGIKTWEKERQQDTNAGPRNS